MNLRLPSGLRSKSQVLFQFFMAQGLTMAANLLYGLLCVRLLPTNEYAKFVVVFGVQGSLLGIMDANLSGTLIPLIGERVGNHKLIADYVASLKQLALGAYFLVCTGFIFLYPLLVKNRHWNWQTIAAMIGILLVSTWSFRLSTIYGAVMIVLRDRNRWYKGQMISALGTLAMLLAAWSLHRLGAFQAILFNVVGMIFVGWYYSRCARQLLQAKGEVSTEKRRSIIKLALPSMPGALFYAIQGQIPLYLITFLGHTTGVASIGALARLGQIFAIFQQGFPILVEPYFAKLSKDRLLKAYLTTLGLGASLCVLLILSSIAAPQVFLWVLGPQYAGLNFELRLVVVGSAIGFLNGVFWSMHSARRFVYWWTIGVNLGITFVVQLLFILFVDMSSVRSALWMSISMNLVSFAVSVACGFWGFTRGPREVEQAKHGESVELIEAEAVFRVSNGESIRAENL